jgi:hypothetical protein
MLYAFSPSLFLKNKTRLGGEVGKIWEWEWVETVSRAKKKKEKKRNA